MEETVNINELRMFIRKNVCAMKNRGSSRCCKW